MKLVSLFLGVTGAYALDPKIAEWINWKQRYGFKFSDVEDQRRYQIFDQNRDLVEEHNQDYKDGKTKFTLKLNKFAALTVPEFREKYLVKREEKLGEKGVGMLEWKCPHSFVSSGAPLPNTVSYSQGQTCWESTGACDTTPVYTTAIKDQGNCGSCWTFGTAAAIEGSLCKSGRYDCSTWSGVAAQEFVDCASHTGRNDDEEYVYDLSPYDNGGCNGGFQSNAMRYVMKNNDAMMSWDDYAYTAGTTGKRSTCKFNPATAIPEVLTSCGDLSGCSEATMANAINELGVLTVGMDASGPKIMLYDSGIYSNDLCRPQFLDHAVSLSGFGVYPYPGGDAYWEMRNSWGTEWGMNGYMLMEKDTGDQCGFTTDVQYVVA